MLLAIRRLVRIAESKDAKREPQSKISEYNSRLITQANVSSPAGDAGSSDTTRFRAFDRCGATIFFTEIAGSDPEWARPGSVSGLCSDAALRRGSYNRFRGEMGSLETTSEPRPSFRSRNGPTVTEDLRFF